MNETMENIIDLEFATSFAGFMFTTSLQHFSRLSLISDNNCVVEEPPTEDTLISGSVNYLSLMNCIGVSCVAWVVSGHQNPNLIRGLGWSPISDLLWIIRFSECSDNFCCLSELQACLIHHCVIVILYFKNKLLALQQYCWLKLLIRDCTTCSFCICQQGVFHIKEFDPSTIKCLLRCFSWIIHLSFWASASLCHPSRNMSQ